MLQHLGSWHKALSFSLILHLIIAVSLAAYFTLWQTEQPKAEYIIDLDLYEQAETASQNKAELFPEPLSNEETHSRLVQAASANAAALKTAPLASDDTTVKSIMSDTNAAAADITTASNGTDANAGANNSSTNAPADGNGTKTNTNGNNQTAASNSPKTPFDFNGFANAVESNKDYPYQAIKRGLEGSVTMRIVLNDAGALVSCSIINSAGNSLLDNAAIRAVQKACPYPNPEGVQVTFTTTLHFILN